MLLAFGTCDFQLLDGSGLTISGHHYLGRPLYHGNLSLSNDWMPSFYRTKKWYRLRASVLDRDGHKCAYCGDRAGTADHIIPRYKGGPDTMDNLVAACTRCNALVGGRVFPSLDAKKKWVTRAILNTPASFGVKKVTPKKRGWRKSPPPKSAKKKST